MEREQQNGDISSFVHTTVNYTTNYFLKHHLTSTITNSWSPASLFAKINMLVLPDLKRRKLCFNCTPLIHGYNTILRT
jgi:hypothetical protein